MEKTILEGRLKDAELRLELQNVQLEFASIKAGNAAMRTLVDQLQVTDALGNCKINNINVLHAGEKARKRGIHPDFETQGKRHQNSKTGVSVAHLKNLCPPNFKKQTNKQTKKNVIGF